MDIENKLRELFLPVFGLDSVDEINPEASLISDLGADSLDFVEILHLIEVHFGVTIKADEIIAGGVNINSDGIFVDGKLTHKGLSLLQENFSQKKDSFRLGMTKIALFSLIAVRDIANIVELRRQQGGRNA